MNNLIEVKIQNDQQLVSARDLYKGLEVKRRFSLWVKDNFSEFIEGEDFSPVLISTQQNQYGGTREIQDYALTLDMAKQLAVMSHTPLGKTYRQYFIALEKKWNDPQEVVKRGYAILQSENTQLKIENEQMKPKALFADAVAVSHSSILIGELAKIMKQNGVNIGQNRLFEWMRANGYLISGNRSDKNMPTQKSLELGLFKIKETVINHSDGHTTINKTPKVTGKGQQYFINKFLQMA
ncbi:phage antirepressor KilAC domain-containing protein [Latilactobacillus curvatus]|uniref:phage antirepressor KilAC domain-containing protein n=1 Tax=Latilactobacillus curvatus TaxID=28038 RepID=UPI0028B55B9C|nr:phage antirepressor KilAC domain-containing protein [Latilactobacillus curvatus]MDT7016327.1 phage antirepressor KilAC domain-containing protein [Latilactobacillus curvatus]